MTVDHFKLDPITRAGVEREVCHWASQFFRDNHHLPSLGQIIEQTLESVEDRLPVIVYGARLEHTQRELTRGLTE